MDFSGRMESSLFEEPPELSHIAPMWTPGKDHFRLLEMSEEPAKMLMRLKLGPGRT